MSTDWFRKRTWSSRDEADFNQRLARSRSESRPQYLRIQATTLLEAGKANVRAAAQLFDRVIAEYPDSLDLKMALIGKGRCLEALDDLQGALACYRSAIEERRWPNVQSSAWLDFVWLVARENIRDEYGAALKLFDESEEDGFSFPAQEFRSMASRALILAEVAQTEAARPYARRALEAAAKRHSGLSRHSDVGLVGETDPAIASRLSKLFEG